MVNGGRTMGLWHPWETMGEVVLPPKYFLLLPAKYERMSTKNVHSIPLG